MAKNTGALKHVHQYFRRDDGRWACMRDGCTHFMPKNMAPAPAGSMSICHQCEKEFKLYPFNMTVSHPVCDTCSEELEAIGRVLEEQEARAEAAGAFRKDPYALFRTKPKLPAKPVEEDEVEVIEPDDIE